MMSNVNMRLGQSKICRCFCRRKYPEGKRIRKGYLEDFTSLGFDTKSPLKIITHGWCGQNDDDTKAEIFKIGNGFMSRSDKMGILEVFWGHYSNGQYFQAARNLDNTAQLFTQFLLFLYQSVYEGSHDALKVVHFIGFSLGAQMLSRACHFFKELTKVDFFYFTGLDPAGPSFDNHGENYNRAMKRGDARWMDVYHTGCRILGTNRRSGNFDFWPNGGWAQPGCFKVGFICDHKSALKFYLNTLTRGKEKLYPFIQCNDWRFSARECLRKYKNKPCRVAHMGAYMWEYFNSDGRPDAEQFYDNYAQYTDNPWKPSDKPRPDQCKYHIE